VTVLLVLIPLGLMLLVAAMAAFAWAVGHDQFEDLESEGARILFEEEAPASSPRPETASAGDGP
jgi:cbb3-type cytochrome oxidase maturation protein